MNALNERRQHRMHGCIGSLVGQAVGCDWRSSDDTVFDVLAEWPPAPATEGDTEASVFVKGKQRLATASPWAMAAGFVPVGCRHLERGRSCEAIKP